MNRHSISTWAAVLLMGQLSTVLRIADWGSGDKALSVCDDFLTFECFQELPDSQNLCENGDSLAFL